jgi:hypothetical protein
VTVCDVMGHLAWRPAAVTVRSIQLLVRKSAEGGTQPGGSLFDVGQVLLLLFCRKQAGVGNDQGQRIAIGRLPHHGQDADRGLSRFFVF